MATDRSEVLPILNRFHVRLTALYAVAVFGVLGPMGLIFYHLGVDQEIEALQQRILTTTASIASGLDIDALRSIATPADKTTAAYRSLERRLEAVSRADPEMRNIYIMLQGNAPGDFIFVIDHDRDRPEDSAAIGDHYDGSALAKMMLGLERPSVEDRVTVDAWGPSLAGWSPIFDAAGRSVGLVGIDVLGRRVEAAQRNILMVCAGVSVLALLLLSLAAILVGRNVREPLGRMIEATGAIAAGDLEARVGLRRSDEFGVVGLRFDNMAIGLEEREYIRDTFGRYVSEDVARSLLADRSQTRLGGEVRDVTVVFSDLRGYSTISEELAPAEVVDLLNRYLGAMNELIDEAGGVVIEFLGDAILAVFGAPNDLEGHAEIGLRCAEAMGHRLIELNQAWEEEGIASRWQKVGLAKLGQRIGIHTGPVIAGNLGSRKRAKYAVIGDTVNVASRLEGLNKELGAGDADGVSQLLFSDAVYEALPAAMQARALKRGEFLVKGRQQAVGAWTLTDAQVSA